MTKLIYKAYSSTCFPQ